ncbi:dihydropteroate synthase [Desulfatitalea alkaliphila]|uniref:Dihydropteroate synthase n=1 Tax=Desulfatitalea alkaliphila TaxID=2929485 RepID=A0AA41R3Y1_9BACT|nr:dihydropteroate synthase [Desulfatitalea alkaliphila]MCJ8500450.1 dihydropteroate synthase [Desulfatitalea alkaliphila]
MHHHTLRWHHRELALGDRTAIMGIVNVTPDSFSDGGAFYNEDAAVNQALRLVKDGADILDIGGESTRPYAEDVPAIQEAARVVPVIRRLTERVPVPISIDTTKAEVADAALAAGASMINDIGALAMDPEMAAVAVRHKVPVIVMHMQGTPRTMQNNPTYTDLIGEVRRFLQDAIDRAVAAGIDPQHIIIDPGIGFGKTAAHNLELIGRLASLADLKAPLLVGPSRKAFIRKTLAAALGQEPAADRPEVETGTQAAIAMAVMQGAHIVRVHNVANTRANVRMLDALRRAAA